MLLTLSTILTRQPLASIPNHPNGVMTSPHEDHILQGDKTSYGQRGTVADADAVLRDAAKDVVREAWKEVGEMNAVYQHGFEVVYDQLRGLFLPAVFEPIRQALVHQLEVLEQEVLAQWQAQVNSKAMQNDEGGESA